MGDDAYCAHLLCSAFGMFGSRMKSHQSLVRPLPSADIAEHRASYTSALLGLCLQSKAEEEEREHVVFESLGAACQDWMNILTTAELKINMGLPAR